MSERACTLPGAGRREEDPAREAGRCLGALECDYCDVCILTCPELCIGRDRGTGHIVIDLELCKGCGLCAHYCPKGAIRMVADL
jgi:Pyruvate/2-oxoacid:ferredoxin oxidoreductase delta subunit